MLPIGLAVRNPPVNAGDAGDEGLIAGLGRSPGEGNGNPLQFLHGKFHRQRSLASCSPWGCKQSDTTEQLTDTHIQTSCRRDIACEP